MPDGPIARSTAGLPLPIRCPGVTSTYTDRMALEGVRDFVLWARLSLPRRARREARGSTVPEAVVLAVYSIRTNILARPRRDCQKIRLDGLNGQDRRANVRSARVPAPFAIARRRSGSGRAAPDAPPSGDRGPRRCRWEVGRCAAGSKMASPGYLGHHCQPAPRRSHRTDTTAARHRTTQQHATWPKLRYRQNRGQQQPANFHQSRVRTRQTRGPLHRGAPVSSSGWHGCRVGIRRPLSERRAGRGNARAAPRQS